MAENTKQKKQEIADAEYARLVGLYRAAGVDEIKLKSTTRSYARLRKRSRCWSR